VETNKRILKIGIIIIIATLVIGLGATFYLRLDNPVFLKSYIEIDMPILDNGRFGDTGFEIRYITNANDNRVVNHIEFDEVPGLSSSANESNHYFDSGFFVDQNKRNPGDVVGRYSIRTIFIRIDAYEIEKILEDKHLTKAKIYFNNGETMETDIGDIVLYGYNNSDKHLDFNYSGSSSDNTSRTQGRVKEDITLIKVESPILEHAKEFVEFKIDNVGYDNISEKDYSIGDSMVVDSMFNTPDDPILKFNTYSVNPKLTFKDKDGNIFTHRFYNVDYRYYGFELMEIVEYLRARGEI